MSWATYTARILVVTYFTMSPFFYFFYFGILTKENEKQNVLLHISVIFGDRIRLVIAIMFIYESEM